MKPLVVHCDVDAPRERLFEIATDLKRWPERVSAINKIEIVEGDGMAVGTVFRETRTMFGREATETMTVAELEAPSRFLLTADSHGSHYRSEFRIDERESGCRLMLSFEATPKSFFAKLMSFMMKPMMKKMAQMCLKDLEDMKRAAEVELGSEGDSAEA
ncbi:MAG: SRPBCC family protein [Planctomycetota bacterium]